MRWHLLIACTLLNVIGGVYPRSVPETIHAIGDADDTHVQMLYDMLGGTFVLPFEGANGQNLTITGLHMIRGKEGGTVAEDNPLDLDPRAPQPFTTKNVQCTHPPTYLDQLLTIQQRQFIAGKFCPFVANAQPYVWALIGVSVSNLACGPNFKYLCQGFWALSSTVSGVYLGPSIQGACDSSLAQLNAECGQNGGTQTVAITGGNKFLEEAFATEDTASACRNGQDDEKCATYSCYGQCNPGYTRPG